MLVVAFCRQNIASIVLEFDGASRLHSSFQTAKIDYSGLPLLKAITSASEEEIHRLTRFWVYGNGSQTDGDGSPFLFINGGAATLSGSTLGAVTVRDTVTQREIQLLEHAAIAGRRVSAIAYHVSNDKYSIATADRGANATIKIWTAQRSPSSPQSRPRRGFLTQKRWVVATLLATFMVTMLSKIERLPDTDEISQFCFQTALTFAKVCIKIGYLVLDTAEGAVSDAEDALN